VQAGTCPTPKKFSTVTIDSPGTSTLIFENWEASLAPQAVALGPILERECGAAQALRILDCACGMGIQSLGLAGRGYRLTGYDLRPAAVARASAETHQRRPDLHFCVADMWDLSPVLEGEFDAVVCLDNGLPHLDSSAQLLEAPTQMRRKLRQGCLFMASSRDYDRLLVETSSWYWQIALPAHKSVSLSGWTGGFRFTQPPGEPFSDCVCGPMPA
jgi:2-polyprenyl-3-methyl-5-hydroxy-6-metoxy-1,4-benzoquinol methylase